MKVDFSSDGCQKLSNWVKITDQNAPVCQKNILQQVLKKKITTYFTVLLLNAFEHSSNSFFSLLFDYKVFKVVGRWLQILDTQGEFQFST